MHVKLFKSHSNLLLKHFILSNNKKHRQDVYDVAFNRDLHCSAVYPFMIICLENVNGLLAEFHCACIHKL